MIFKLSKTSSFDCYDNQSCLSIGHKPMTIKRPTLHSLTMEILTLSNAKSGTHKLKKVIVKIVIIGLQWGELHNCKLIITFSFKNR